MELVTQHYSRSYRRHYERSISEQRFENRQHFLHDFYKGHNINLRKIQEDSYQQENSLRYNEEDCDYEKAKDLRIDKRVTAVNCCVGGGIIGDGDRERLDIDCSAAKIKQEPIPQQSSSNSPSNASRLPPRRYFCIFCKLDFALADDFLEHLELHPNGSFVLVKRDLPPPTLSLPPPPSQQQQPQQPPPPAPPSPKIIINHHRRPNINNNNDDDDDKSDEFTKVSNGHCGSLIRNSVSKNINNNEEESEEEAPIIPEMLKNQIKIEPISEDDEEEEQQRGANHISNTSSSFNHDDAPQYNNNNNNSKESTISNNHATASDGSDPNQQLLVLSNPRIGDGPGEYLCNVCQAKFVYKNNLKSHLKRHLGIYPYVCFCGKRYQFKCKLNKHIEQAHAKIKNFKCPVPTCPKKYFTRNDLAFHISVTHQERQEIPCNICQKVFNSQKSLQIHCRKYHRNQES